MKAAPRTTASTRMMGLVIMISRNLSTTLLFSILNATHKIMEVTPKKITSKIGRDCSYHNFFVANTAAVFFSVPLHNIQNNAIQYYRSAYYIKEHNVSMKKNT